MCYRLSDDLWVEGIYPLKLHEYLAAGRPIVSADVPSIRPFADVVAIARDAVSGNAHLSRAQQRRTRIDFRPAPGCCGEQLDRTRGSA